MDNKHGRSDSEEAVANKASGKWNQVKGNVKEAWGDLTDNPSRSHEGTRDRIKGEMQEEYGEVKEKESRIERDLDDMTSGRH